MLTLEQIRQVVREELQGKGVALEFSDLTKVEGGDSFLPHEDGDWPDLYTADSELEKLTRGEPLSLMKSAGAADLGWDEEVSTPLVKRAAPQDGTVIEKCGKQTWTYTYRSGELVKAKVQDPDLPGGVMDFDENGNEVEVAA